MICNKCNHNLPADSEFCQYCGNKINLGFVASTLEVEEPVKPVVNNSTVKVSSPAKTSPSPQFTQSASKYSGPKSVKSFNPDEKLVSFVNISSIVLTVLACVSIIIAMNVQDSRRNLWENWNTTNVYLVLLVIFAVFLCFAIVSLLKNRFVLVSSLSPIPVIATIITLCEGSVMAYVSDSYFYYSYAESVHIFNCIWVVCIFLTFIISLLPVFVILIKNLHNSWMQTISYREHCYKRVAKMHKYLEKGIITEEEYEQTKKEILKHIIK